MEYKQWDGTKSIYKFETKNKEIQGISSVRLPKEFETA